jgi:hypothetical protein
MASNNPTPSSPSAGDERKPEAGVDAAPVTGPGFEERLREFWEANQTRVFALCVFVLVMILGKGLWEQWQIRREAGISEAFGKAVTADQQRAFVKEHDGHRLAGAALLKLADEAYEASRFADAMRDYDLAAGKLKEGPLAARARIGAAVARVQGTERAAGEGALKAIASDLNLPAIIRAEASFHLATLAADAGDVATVQSLADQITAIDAESFWAQRAMMLRATLPAAAVPAAAPVTGTPKADAPVEAAPAVTFPGAGKGK